MRAAELMTNDYVMGKHGKPVKVTNVLWTAIMTDDREGLDELTGEIQPIPLSLEILEKIGFMKFIAGQYILSGLEEDYFVSAIPNLQAMQLPNNKDAMLVAVKHNYSDVRVTVNYLHELQHLFRLVGLVSVADDIKLEGGEQ